ncbi:MAG: cupin domain-containing protein, partial [Caulobacteraceae bacterium]
MDRPDFIRHWRELEKPDESHYPGDDELMSIGAPLGRLLGLTRIGIHHERLPPSRRTSFPHAESLEEEFVFVLEGTPDAWIDGHLHRLEPGDAVGLPAGTGICHSFLNNT